MLNLPTTQVRIIVNRCTLQSGSYRRNDVIWVNEQRARELIDAGVAAFIAPVPGPSESKPAEPSEKKSSAAAPAGPSTASLKFNAPGTEAPSSASPADPVSPPRKRRARKADKTPPEDPSASSQ